jgi:hypothetical protein
VREGGGGPAASGGGPVGVPPRPHVVGGWRPGPELNTKEVDGNDMYESRCATDGVARSCDGMTHQVLGCP